MTTGVRATELVWESTAISTSTVAKFGGPILAVAATNTSSGGGSSTGGDTSKPQSKTRQLDPAETSARNAAVKELSKSHSPQKAGTAFHNALGAAPKGVDLNKHKGAFQVELKTHYTRYLTPSQISSASLQSLKYSLNSQLSTGLVPIRQVRHYMLNPKVYSSGLRIDSH